MSKIDHEKKNMLDKLKISEPEKILCAAPDQKTIKRLSKGTPRLNISNPRILCLQCNKKVYLKKLQRHNQLCHDPISCPYCVESFNGTKKLKSHIIKVHGQNNYIIYKQHLTNNSSGSGNP